jgi:hypothetical protein
MEPTVTNSANPVPAPTDPRSVLDRLRVFGWDAASLSGGMMAWQRAGGEIR